MKGLSLLSVFILFISCKEVRLSTCDVDVYHGDEFTPEQLDEIRENAFYQKNWNISFIEKNDETFIDRSKQHASISHNMEIKIVDSKRVEYGEVTVSKPTIFGPNWNSTETAYIEHDKASGICTTNLKFFSPELDESKVFTAKDSIDSEYMSYPIRAIRKDVERLCEKSVVTIVKKLPKCSIK